MGKIDKKDPTSLAKEIEELRAENSSLKEALKAAGIAYWDWNPKANVVTFDKEWFQQINILDKDSSKLDSWMDSLHPDDAEPVQSKIKEHLEGKTPFYEALMRLKTKANEYCYVLAKGKVLIKDKDGVPTKFSGVHVDLTEMMRLKEENEAQKYNLIHSAKMAALGEMAGGIAHEINTPLTVIQGYAEYLNTLDLNKKEVHELVRENLSKIEKTTSKIYNIIKGLQLFARDGKKDPKEMVELKEFINENCDIVESKLLQRNIKINVDCPDNLLIPMRQVQMSQVIINLLNNARDAISNLDQRWIEIKVVDLKNEVMIEITDSGLGIPESVAVKIFNPFFTTKPVGQGTGLGLSISKGIIEDHGGVFSLKQNSVNTCFQIKLPKNGENDEQQPA